MSHSNLQHLFKKIQTFLGNICPTQEYASNFKTRFLNLNYPHIYSIHLLGVFTFSKTVCVTKSSSFHKISVRNFSCFLFFCMYVIEIDCRFQVPTLPHVLNYFFYSIWPPVCLLFNFLTASFMLRVLQITFRCHFSCRLFQHFPDYSVSSSWSISKLICQSSFPFFPIHVLRSNKGFQSQHIVF